MHTLLAVAPALINKIILAGWAMSVMLGLSPLPKQGNRWQEDQTVAERRHAPETAADKLTRFRSIATDLVEVISEDGALPGMTKRQSMSVMLSIMSYESSFFRDVDLGQGRGVGDQGRSWCLMQLQVNESTAPVLENGKRDFGGGTIMIKHDVMGKWTGRDLVQDRKKCLRAGRAVLVRAMAECHDQKASDKLSAYATGSCKNNEPKSASRWDRSILIMKKRVPKLDEALKLLGREGESVEEPPPAEPAKPATPPETTPERLTRAG